MLTKRVKDAASERTAAREDHFTSIIKAKLLGIVRPLLVDSLCEGLMKRTTKEQPLTFRVPLSLRSMYDQMSSLHNALLYSDTLTGGAFDRESASGLTAAPSTGRCSRPTRRLQEGRKIHFRLSS